MKISRGLCLFVAATCLVAGSYGWLVFAYTFRHPGSIGIDYNAVGLDWMGFYTAAQEALFGHLAALFDGDLFTQDLNARFGSMLRHRLGSQPFLYPPHFLLVVTPFGLLPFWASYAAFQLLTFAGLLAAARVVAPDRRFWIVAASLLLCPATSINVVLGNTGILATALLAGGCALAGSRPILAGILLGALTIRPQLGLLVPLALIAARQWRVFASATVTVLCLVAASVLCFGVMPWMQYLAPLGALIGNPAAPTTRALDFRWDVMMGTNTYATIAALFGPGWLAASAQGLAMVLGGAIVWRSFRRPVPPDLGVAVLLPASLLAAPLVASHDNLALAFAATLLFCRAFDDGLRPGELSLFLLAWILPLGGQPILGAFGMLTPLATAGVAVTAMQRLAGTSPR